MIWRGYVRGIGVLCESGRVDEAERLAASAPERIRHQRDLLVEQALICFYSRDWREGRRRYAHLRERFPDEPAGYTRGAEVAMNLDDGASALSILEQGVVARPDDHALLRKAAEAAEGTSSWSRAVDLWDRLHVVSDAADAPDRGARCRHWDARFDVQADRASRFESMGGGSKGDDLWAYGCEFGYYQRSLRLEPLDFLRWASIPPAKLLEGLRDRFDGISDPAGISFMRNDDDPIWNLLHVQYGIRIDHTGMYKKDRSEEEARRGLVTHLSYLRDKFIEDLEDGEKIFVYRTFDHVMPDAQVSAIASAIKAYGPAQFLYVRLAAPDRASRTVERVSDNLLVGHIDAFAPREGRVLVPNHDGWERICEAALDLV